MPDTPEVLDAVPVDDIAPEHHNPTEGHFALERRPPPSREVLMPLDVEQVVKGMQAYQEMLPKLLTDSDYQSAGWDAKLGRERKFVKKSGWRKIARAFNLSTEIVSLRIERDEEGNPQRAEAVVRAIAPNGLVSDGDGYCDVGEERFGRSGGRAKIENDLRATATTRAKNRAISDLVGMGDVSAEEASAVDVDATPGHPWGERADQAPGEQAFRALAYILNGPDEGGEARAHEVWDAILSESSPTADAQFMPRAAARAIALTAKHLKAAVDSDWGEPADPLPTATAALDDMVDETVETVKGGTWAGMPVRGGEETAEADRIAEEAFSDPQPPQFRTGTTASTLITPHEEPEPAVSHAVVSEDRRDQLVAEMGARQLNIGTIRTLLKGVGENVPTSDLRTEEGINAVIGRLTLRQADDLDHLIGKLET